MNIYMTVNDDSTVKAFYDSALHKDIPSNAIQITKDVYDAYFNVNFHEAIYLNDSWAEGLTQEEIDAEQLLSALHPTPQELADADLEIKMLTLLMEMEVI